MVKTTKGEMTKQQIVEAVKHKFYEKGYASTTIEEIAEEANIKKSLLLYHYPNKKTIGDAIMNDFYNAAYQRIEQYVDDDALLRWMLVQKIYDYKIMNDPMLYDFHVQRTYYRIKDIDFTPSTVIDFYQQIVDQFNLPVSASKLRLKSLQILGANASMIVYNREHLSQYSDKELFEESIFVVCNLLGVGASTTQNTYKAALMIFENIPHKDIRIM